MKQLRFLKMSLRSARSHFKTTLVMHRPTVFGTGWGYFWTIKPRNG